MEQGSERLARITRVEPHGYGVDLGGGQEGVINPPRAVDGAGKVVRSRVGDVVRVRFVGSGAGDEPQFEPVTGCTAPRDDVVADLLAQLTPHEARLLLDALAFRGGGCTGFEFNLFDVEVLRDQGRVVVGDVLDAGRSTTVPLDEFHLLLVDHLTTQRDTDACPAGGARMVSDDDLGDLLRVAQGLEMLVVSLDRIGSRAGAGRDMAAEPWEFVTARGGREAAELRSRVFEVLGRHLPEEAIDAAMLQVDAWSD